MPGIRSKSVKASDKNKLIKALKITEQDIEFILIAIKNSMISGSSLEQAVSTIEKLQKIYEQLQKAGQGGSGDQTSAIAARRAQAEREEVEEDN